MSYVMFSVRILALLALMSGSAEARPLNVRTSYPAAEMILDSQLTGALLAERVAALAADRARLQAMGAAAAALAVPDAAVRVAAVCRQVVVEEGVR